MEVIHNICRFLDTLDTLRPLSRFFYELAQDRLLNADWALTCFGEDALAATLLPRWTGGLWEVKYMVTMGADLLFEDGAWIVKLLRLGKTEFVMGILCEYEDVLFRPTARPPTGSEDDGAESDEDEDPETDDEEQQFVTDGNDVTAEGVLKSPEGTSVQDNIRRITRVAVAMGSAKVVLMLLQHGYKSSRTLAKFCEIGDHPLVNYLLKLRDTLHVSFREKSLAFAALKKRVGDIDMYKLFVYHGLIQVDFEHGDFVTSGPSLLFSPLDEAIARNRVDFFDFLFNLGIWKIQNPHDCLKRAVRARPDHDGRHIVCRLQELEYNVLQLFPGALWWATEVFNKPVAEHLMKKCGASMEVNYDRYLEERGMPDLENDQKDLKAFINEQHKIIYIYSSDGASA